MGFLLELVGMEFVLQAFSEVVPRVHSEECSAKGSQFRVVNLGWLGTYPSNPD